MKRWTHSYSYSLKNNTIAKKRLKEPFCCLHHNGGSCLPHVIATLIKKLQIVKMPYVMFFNCMTTSGY